LRRKVVCPSGYSLSLRSRATASSTDRPLSRLPAKLLERQRVHDLRVELEKRLRQLTMSGFGGQTGKHMLALSFSAVDPCATSRFSGKANHGNERFCQSELGEAFLLISVCAPVATTKFR
jgi:hypothetical protein